MYVHVQCISNNRPLPRENIITFVLSEHVVHLGEDNLPFKNNTSWGKIIPKGKKIIFVKIATGSASRNSSGEQTNVREVPIMKGRHLLDLQTRKVTLATSGNVMRMTLVVSTKFWFNFRDLVYRQNVTSIEFSRKVGLVVFI